MKILVLSSLNELGKELKIERKRLGLTQWEVAERAYTGRETVRTAEAGKYTPHLDTVLAIAKALGYDEIHFKIG